MKVRTTPTKCGTKPSEFGETEKDIDPFFRVKLFREEITLSLSLTGRESEVKSFTGETQHTYLVQLVFLGSPLSPIFG